MWGHSGAPVAVPFLLCSVHSLLAQAAQLAPHLPSSKMHSVHPDSVTPSLCHVGHPLIAALTPFISPVELPWDALSHELLSPCAP